MFKIPKDPFILVDGSSYLFRAYHALPPLTNSKGNPTGAIYGVINMLRKLLSEYKPSKMAVVFDSKEKNFRHALYDAYKANRIMMPDELQIQIEPLHDIIKAMGLPLVVIPGVEADDVIGTLAVQAKKEGLLTLISTGDKDFAQLVDENIILINTMSGEIYDRSRVIEKFEVPPEKIIDYLALIGDSVDNIPGVPKVGPKTALKWLEVYGSLDNIICCAEEIPGKVGENLKDTLDKLPLYRKLVTIDVEVSLPFSYKDFSIAAADEQKLKALFTELEFKTWLKALGEKQNSQTEGSPTTTEISVSEENKKVDYETILTQEHFEHWLTDLEQSTLFAFDIETTSLDYMSAEIVGISFALKPGQAAYVPFIHDYEGAPSQLERTWVLTKLKPLLENEKSKKIGHNLKYDLEVLASHNITLRGIAFDTMLESYVLESTANRHNMDAVALRHLSYKTISYEEVAGKGAKQIPFNKVSIEKASFYAAEDADITLQLHTALWRKLENLPKQKTVFETIEMPLISVLAYMERLGVLVDAKKLTLHSKELEKRLEILENEAHVLAGESFNLSSPKQLQEILFNKLKLPSLEKTPGGQHSTAESVMQELAEKYALPKVILEHRSLTKLKSTYTDKLVLQIDPKTGRIHTSYHQAVTATGRLSSSDPNLQNIPIRTEEGRKVRAAFIAAPGFKIVAFDYSQIELRIMAHLSQDKNLLEAFSLGDDIHRSTAASVFGVSLAAVTSEQRRSAKAINFGLMYGMSVFGLSRQLNIARDEAEQHMQRYFSCFPGVKAFMENTRRLALEQGYVETLMGRRLYLPDLQSRNQAVRRAAERAAINAPMQGTNADIIKLAMIKIYKEIIANNEDVHMIMQVHDELVFEIKENYVEEMSLKITKIMEQIAPLSVKLKVDVGIGANWDEAH